MLQSLTPEQREAVDKLIKQKSNQLFEKFKEEEKKVKPATTSKSLATTRPSTAK